MNANKKGGKKSATVKQKNKPVKKSANTVSLVQKFTGLTLSEHLKLKKLKKELSGDATQSGKQISTQQTITFDKMYKDGICKVRKNYYTKMIEFNDINYVLLDEDERADILGLYSQLINYFDPSINFQIFLFNRHVNEETLAAQFDIAAQGDKFDDIREEFSDMLKNLSAKGKNGVIKTKHIIFGIEAENLKEARQRFISIEADILKNLRNLGTNAKSLDGKERLSVLYEFFNQDKMEPFHFSFKEMAESGNSVKDYIAPQGFEFRFPGRYKMGHMFGATKYLDIISPKLNDELIKRLLDIDSNISLSIHMQTIEPIEAIKLLKRALSDVQKTKIDEQKKAVRAGYDMDILPTDLVLYEKNTMELLDDLNSSNQKLIWTTILISGFGRNKKELESVTQRISGIIQQANCRLIDLQYKQEVAMNAAAPIGINETKEGRHLITKNLAILVPFNTQELFQQGQSLYYGLNALSNNMIMADRKKLRTPNGVILGTPGSGKSFSAKREILGSFLVSRDDILICDPEGEYYPLVKALGGEVVKLATNSKDYLNPMDIQLSHKNDREALKLKSDFLITLCDAIAGGETGLANDEKGIIDRCIEKIYDDYFKDPRPENMPLLEDLYNALIAYEPDKAVSEELAVDAR
ncbi:MAG: conjugal transfer protein TraE, partial [Clostridiales bacterium]|nr:conjugal transfer protein TraE [Clostridiales bacterium]